MTGRRHGAQVTADRLAEAVQAWPDRFTTQEVASAQGIVRTLQRIALHDRTDHDDGWNCSCGASVRLANTSKKLLQQLFEDHAAGESPTTKEETP